MLAVVLRVWYALGLAGRRAWSLVTGRQESDDDDEWEPDPYAEEAWREALDHQHLGSGVGGEYQPSTGRRRLVVFDLGELRARLGDPLLWALTRCLVGVDRLLVISRLQNLANKPVNKTELWALLWMACGTIRELLNALDALCGRDCPSQGRRTYRVDGSPRRPCSLACGPDLSSGEEHDRLPLR